MREAKERGVREAGLSEEEIRLQRLGLILGLILFG